MADGRLPRVLLACGYFDWFSGYQEVGLAKAFASLADTHVLAGDRVNPLFSDEHLARVAQPRRYEPGTTVEHGVTFTRLACREQRSMLWSAEAKQVVENGGYDLVVQVMPGQGLPAAASLVKGDLRRSVLYGDNVAMYADLGSLGARVKHVIFGATKGSLYRAVNRRASHLYGYTPNTLKRLAPFTAGREMQLLPLAFDSAVFAHDDTLRGQWRAEHGYGEDDVVVLAAGKIQTQKRVDALVQAVGRLRSRRPDIRLHIIGADDTTASDAVRAAARDLGQEGAVTIEGFVGAPVLNRAFNGADLGVWPVMPAITIQQAMGTGLRVLLPENDLVSHLVDRPESGATYPIREPLDDALAEALEEQLGHTTPSGADAVAARHARAEGNAWLSTPSVARRLLSDAGLWTGAA